MSFVNLRLNQYQNRLLTECDQSLNTWPFWQFVTQISNSLIHTDFFVLFFYFLSFSGILTKIHPVVPNSSVWWDHHSRRLKIWKSQDISTNVLFDDFLLKYQIPMYLFGKKMKIWNEALYLVIDIFEVST